MDLGQTGLSIVWIKLTRNHRLSNLHGNTSGIYNSPFTIYDATSTSLIAGQGHKPKS
jgi:hypothetical protein